MTIASTHFNCLHLFPKFNNAAWPCPADHSAVSANLPSYPLADIMDFLWLVREVRQTWDMDFTYTRNAGLSTERFYRYWGSGNRDVLIYPDDPHERVCGLPNVFTVESTRVDVENTIVFTSGAPTVEQTFTFQLGFVFDNQIFGDLLYPIVYDSATPGELTLNWRAGLFNNGLIANYWGTESEFNAEFSPPSWQFISEETVSFLGKSQPVVFYFPSNPGTISDVSMSFSRSVTVNDRWVYP